MLNSVFYHSLLRKYITVFGNMFNDIYLSRIDATTNTHKTTLVPIHYGPQEKWLAVFNKPLSERKVAISLPLLSFNITSLYFDTSRTTSPLNKVSNITETNKTLTTAYNLVPYKLGIDLFIFGKYSDDVSQIFEQIAPYFNPSFTNNTDLIPELNLKKDIVTRMTGISMQDIYEGDMTTRRQLVWTISFEMDIYFIGPLNNQGVIKRIDLDLVPTDYTTKITGMYEHLTTQPGLTSDGKPTTKLANSIPYKQIEATDNYAYIEEWETRNENT